MKHDHRRRSYALYRVLSSFERGRCTPAAGKRLMPLFDASQFCHCINALIGADGIQLYTAPGMENRRA